MLEFWNQRYAEPGFAYGDQPNVYFAQKLAGIAPGKMLLPAEGEGRNAVHAASLGWDVLALDYSQAGREKAMKLAQARDVSIRYELADLNTWQPPRARFDAIGMIYTHFPAPIRHALWARLLEALAPGGYLIAEVFDKNQLGKSSGGPQSLEMLCQAQEFAALLEGFDVLEMEETQTLLHEGQYHEGWAEVLRIFARKH